MDYTSKLANLRRCIAALHRQFVADPSALALEAWISDVRRLVERRPEITSEFMRTRPLVRLPDPERPKNVNTILIYTKRLRGARLTPHRIKAWSPGCRSLVTPYDPTCSDWEVHRRAMRYWLERWQLEGSAVTVIDGALGVHMVRIADDVAAKSGSAERDVAARARLRAVREAHK